MLKRISAFIENLIRRVSARRRKPFGVIEHDASKIRLAWTLADGSEHPSEAECREVSRVVAYKRDLVIYDLLSLAVLVSGRQGLDVNEEMKGWGELVEKLPEYLPGCQAYEQWFQTVAFPAFSMNPTEIYKREQPAAPEQTEPQTDAPGQTDAQTEAPERTPERAEDGEPS